MDTIRQMLRDGLKPGVGLDMDNTTASLDSNMVPGLNKMLGTNYTAKDLNSTWYWMERELHLDRSVFWLLYNDAWMHYKTLKPLITPQELELVSQHYRVDFITAKESHATMPYVFDFISMHFPNHRGAVIEVDLGNRKTDFGHRILVDDAPHVAEAVQSERSGKYIYLVRGNEDGEYGYNAHIARTHKVRPVPNTHEAMRKLVMMARSAQESGRVTVTKARDIG